MSMATKSSSKRALMLSSLSQLSQNRQPTNRRRQRTDLPRDFGLKTNHMSPQPQTNPSPQNPSRKNIEAIAQLERDALGRRSLTERFSENTVKSIGSIAFLILNALLLGAWTLINVNRIPGLQTFAGYSIALVAFVVSVK